MEWYFPHYIDKDGYIDQAYSHAHQIEYDDEEWSCDKMMEMAYWCSLTCTKTRGRCTECFKNKCHQCKHIEASCTCCFHLFLFNLEDSINTELSVLKQYFTPEYCFDMKDKIIECSFYGEFALREIYDLDCIFIKYSNYSGFMPTTLSCWCDSCCLEM